MKNRFLPLFALLLLSFSAQAQIAFTNESSLLSETDFSSGVAIGVVDMNNDGLDDIIRMENGSGINIEYQNAPGAPFTNQYVDSDGSLWAVAAADVDNDGFSDIFSGGAYNQVKLYRRQVDGTYDKSYMPGATLFVQGSNFADINNDGWLDVFSCHDDAESRIWSNNGDGSFATADEWIDMTTTPASDNSGNYGSVWTDFDNDGDLDLYIAKCRQGVNSSTDPRRINQLYINDGTNNFSEQAEARGLKIGAQSWTADFGDYDNDGDMDCFVTNHDAPSQLLENDGAGYFTDVTENSGISIDGLPIQGIFTDLDNDGLVDILVSGTTQYVYHNNGDGTFTDIAAALPGTNQMQSFAVGDLNNDGFTDLYAGYASGFNNPTNTDDALMMNVGNDNNWLNVRPVGVISNRQAVGARITITGDFGTQIREIRAGESYGISNSLTAHFGLSTFTSVTNVVVRFPSGIIVEVENPDINETLVILEEGCFGADIDIEYEGETELCPGEVLTLSAPESPTYMWSNGAETQSIDVTQSGNYTVTVTDPEGCFSIASPVYVNFVQPVIPTVEITSPVEVCEGGTVTLTASGGESYLWNTFENTQSIEVSESGEYFVSSPGLCDSYTSEVINVEIIEYQAALPLAENDTIYAPGTAVLTADGDQSFWYATPDSEAVIGTGNFFTTPFIEETTAFYVENLQDFAGSTENVGMTEHSGNSQYGGNQFNGTIIFDAFEPFVLRSVRVYTDTPGPRTVEVRNQFSSLLASVTVAVPVGESVIDLNLEVPAGENLELGTNTEDNQQNFGFNSARLQRNNTGTDYPYTVEDVVSLKESGFGPDWYYYFYDWEIETAPIQCQSERAEVLAVVSTSGIFTPTAAETLILSPNPTQGTVSFTLPELTDTNGEILVFDLAGKQVLSQKMTTAAMQALDLRDFAKGAYFVKVVTKGRVFAGKVVKQ